MEFLLGICKQSDFYADEAGFTAPERIATIEDAIAEFDKLRLLVRSRLSP